MTTTRHQSTVWQLVRAQHGVVARRQLLELGVSAAAIKHRIRAGRLHPVRRGVYAVGRPDLTAHGQWMAAVLACGPTAALADESAAQLWGIRRRAAGPTHVIVCDRVAHRWSGVVVHRRTAIDVVARNGIPVSSPIDTLIDLAATLGRNELEAAISEADKLDLIDPEALRAAVGAKRPRPGVGVLKRTLDDRVFTLTDSALERLFRPIATRAGLPKPQTRRIINGFRADFFWPHLGLVVETDGLRYHRTPAQQARDRIRDQRHAAAGLTPVRFTYEQVYNDPVHVERTLRAIAQRLAAA